MECSSFQLEGVMVTSTKISWDRGRETGILRSTFQNRPGCDMFQKRRLRSDPRVMGQHQENVGEGLSATRQRLPGDWLYRYIMHKCTTAYILAVIRSVDRRASGRALARFERIVHRALPNYHHPHRKSAATAQASHPYPLTTLSVRALAGQRRALEHHRQP